MKTKKQYLQPDRVLAFCLVFFLFAICGCFFDFYYDLNDDVLIKDIVSGVYTGTPDAHSIQMLYPLSLLISLLYRLFPALPWQGLFLCAAHGICFYLIAVRSLSFIQNKIGKIFCILVELLLILTLFLREFVMVQYTVTAGLLAACACFLVFTSPQRDTSSAFWKEQIPAVLLVIFAFNTRSEMLLLLCPFLAFTGIAKWAQEKEPFLKENVKKYMGLVGLIAAGMFLSWVIDLAAYQTQEWKTFRDFFDARTQVYDYTWYPSYDEAEIFYRENGVTPAKWELIDNYNFGLDESIDADLLWNIADYMKKNGNAESLYSHAKRALLNYKYRLLHNTDVPYHYLVLAAYVIVGLLGIKYRDKKMLWKIPLLFSFRSISWLYVIWADRVPDRIAHPLYVIEFVVLCAWVCAYNYEKNGFFGEENTSLKGAESLKVSVVSIKTTLITGVFLLLLAYAGFQLPQTWDRVNEEMLHREKANASMQALDAYAKAHSDAYYYLDVYSTVAFSEKMFQNVDNGQKNYDILGGWASGSPLQKESTQKYQQGAYSRAELLLCEHFYFVAEEGMDTGFLQDFYKTMGVTIKMEEVTKLGMDDPLMVYSVTPSFLIRSLETE